MSWAGAGSTGCLACEQLIMGKAASVTAISLGLNDLRLFALGRDPEATRPVWTRHWTPDTGWQGWANVPV